MHEVIVLSFRRPIPYKQNISQYFSTIESKIRDLKDKEATGELEICPNKRPDSYLGHSNLSLVAFEPLLADGQVFKRGDVDPTHK